MSSYGQRPGNRLRFVSTCMALAVGDVVVRDWLRGAQCLQPHTPLLVHYYASSWPGSTSLFGFETDFQGRGLYLGIYVNKTSSLYMDGPDVSMIHTRTRRDGTGLETKHCMTTVPGLLFSSWPLWSWMVPRDHLQLVDTCRHTNMTMESVNV